jgi:acetyltransferase-like isoleucine patch superfamily enzyme
MVRFSSSLEDKNPQKRNNQVSQDFDMEYSRLAEKRSNAGERPIYTQEPANYIERPPQVIERYDDYEDLMIEEKPQIQKPLEFNPKDNIQFGVEYRPDSKPPVIGNNYTIRSNSIIYNDVVIGDNFRTGHNVVIRENTNIGDDVLIGTNTVIEGDVIIGNDVSIQSNVYIPTNSVIEDNVFIGPCACFTNDKYPVRINYELQGPRIRRGASIGGNTTFLSNVEVGEGSIVAAGAIVIHSVPPFYLAIGTPARIKPLPDHLKVPNKL